MADMLCPEAVIIHRYSCSNIMLSIQFPSSIVNKQSFPESRIEVPTAQIYVCSSPIQNQDLVREVCMKESSMTAYYSFNWRKIAIPAPENSPIGCGEA